MIEPAGSRQDVAMLSLDDIARGVSPTARTLGAEVVGVTPTGHDGRQAEVILRVAAETADPSHVVVGVNRDAPAGEAERRIAESLREHATTRPRVNDF